MIYEMVKAVVIVLTIGIVTFAAYAWWELRHRTKCTRELARHVRKYYEERESRIEGRKIL